MTWMADCLRYKNGFNKNKLESNPGNGWKNINSRTNLIKGEIEIDTNPETIGTTFILNSPPQMKNPSISKRPITIHELPAIKGVLLK